MTCIHWKITGPLGDGESSIDKPSRNQCPTKCQHAQGRPAGMRVIARKERPHPGAQLRFTDLDGRRFTAFATDAKRGQLADLELRHRQRARCEDRIRCAKDTGLRNLPLKGFAQNQVWCEIVALACDLRVKSAVVSQSEGGVPRRQRAGMRRYAPCHQEACMRYGDSGGVAMQSCERRWRRSAQNPRDRTNTQYGNF